MNIIKSLSFYFVKLSEFSKKIFDKSYHVNIMRIDENSISGVFEISQNHIHNQKEIDKIINANLAFMIELTMNNGYSLDGIKYEIVELARVRPSLPYVIIVYFSKRREVMDHPKMVIYNKRINHGDKA